MELTFFFAVGFGFLAAEALRRTAGLRERIDGLELKLSSARREQQALLERFDAHLPDTAAPGATGEETTAAPEPGGGQPSGVATLPSDLARAAGGAGRSERPLATKAQTTDEDRPARETQPSGDAAKRAQRLPAADEGGSPQLDSPKELESAGPLERTGSSTDGSTTRRARAEAESWERWLGVRGAALVGGIALVFAGIFFVQVAIQRGWLNPAMRDTFAIAAGALGLGFHRPLLARGHRTLGESLGGAGTVLVLGGAWAAAQLHDLIPHLAALLIMSAAVGAALRLAMRSSAQVMMAFALIGGFSTPLLLDTAASSSLSLIGFLLILNGSLLAASRVKKWTWVGLGASIGTFAVQLVWLTLNEAPGGPWGVALSLGLFPVLFGSMLSRGGGSSSPLPAALPLALLAPAVVTLLATPEITSTSTLWPTTALMGVLVLSARLLVRSNQLTLATAITAAGTLTAMALRTRYALKAEVTDWVWTQWAMGLAALAGLLFLGALRARAERKPEAALAPLAVATIGLVAAPFVAYFPEDLDLHRHFTAGVTALALLAIAAGLLTEKLRGALFGGTASGFAVGFLAVGIGGAAPPLGEPLLVAGWTLALGTALLGRLGLADRNAASAAAASIPLFPLLFLAGTAPVSTTPLAVAALTCASALGLTAARRAPWVYALTSIIAAAASLNIVVFLEASSTPTDTGLTLPLASFCVIVASLPLLTLWQREESGEIGQWLALISVAPAVIVAVAACQSERLAGTVLIPRLGLDGQIALLSGAAIALHAARRLAPNQSSSPRARSVVDAATFTLAWVALSKLISFDWPTVALAGSAAAFTFFPARARALGLPVASSLVLGAAGLGLVFSTYVLNTFSSEPFLIPIDVSIDHALVAFALASGFLGLSRLGPKDDSARASIGLGAALLAVAFSWINAVVLNYFSTGGAISLGAERMQSRDLTMSLAWTAFAVLLLAGGVRRSVTGLRWASLLVLVGTVLKVFLYDLGALEGLARVGSFLGLAVCLLGVSLLYGKVLGQDSGRDEPGGDNLLPHDDDPQPDA